MTESLISSKDAAAIAGLSVSTMKRLVSLEKFPQPSRVGDPDSGWWRFDEVEVRAWATKRTKQ